MWKHLRRGVLACLVALVAVVIGAGVASAAPSNAPGAVPLTISCDNDHTYSAVANGNGVWSPAHDLDGTGILIPIAHGTESVVFTDPSGVPHPFSFPADAKGSAVPQGATTFGCSFHGTGSFPDGSSFVLDGTVTGFITPAAQ